MQQPLRTTRYRTDSAILPDAFLGMYFVVDLVEVGERLSAHRRFRVARAPSQRNVVPVGALGQ